MLWRGFMIVMAGMALQLAAANAMPARYDSENTPITMPVGPDAKPPLGHISFCKRHAEECRGGTDNPSTMRLSTHRWSELETINTHVNSTILQTSDMELFEREEWWAFPDERGGDCEDIALLKRRLLIARGWPKDSLLISVVRERNGDGHAVLLAITDRGEFVLDNKDAAIRLWNETPYHWIKRQSRFHPARWVNLDTRTFSVMAGLYTHKAVSLRPTVREEPTASRVPRLRD